MCSGHFVGAVSPEASIKDGVSPCSFHKLKTTGILTDPISKPKKGGIQQPRFSTGLTCDRSFCTSRRSPQSNRRCPQLARRHRTPVSPLLLVTSCVLQPPRQLEAVRNTTGPGRPASRSRSQSKYLHIRIRRKSCGSTNKQQITCMQVLVVIRDLWPRPGPELFRLNMPTALIRSQMADAMALHHHVTFPWILMASLSLCEQISTYRQLWQPAEGQGHVAFKFKCYVTFNQTKRTAMATSTHC